MAVAAIPKIVIPVDLYDNPQDLEEFKQQITEFKIKANQFIRTLVLEGSTIVGYNVLAEMVLRESLDIVEELESILIPSLQDPCNPGCAVQDYIIGITIRVEYVNSKLNYAALKCKKDSDHL